MKTKTRIYGWKVMIDYGYGHGWECECFEDNLDEARQRVKEYRADCSYPVVIRYGWIKA